MNWYIRMIIAVYKNMRIGDRTDIVCLKANINCRTMTCRNQTDKLILPGTKFCISVEGTRVAWRNLLLMVLVVRLVLSRSFMIVRYFYDASSSQHYIIKPRSITRSYSLRFYCELWKHIGDSTHGSQKTGGRFTPATVAISESSA